MKILTDFSTIPDRFAKAAPMDCRVKGRPAVSFPFAIGELDPSFNYLHWVFTDPDSIAVCGFEWIHWTVANVPIGAIMFDFNDSRALKIPEDFSRQLPSMVPEALQGRNSSASFWVGETDLAVTQRYNGPQPPDKDHEYVLQVWATSEPVAKLREGFWMNELFHDLHDLHGAMDYDAVRLIGACAA